MAKSFFFIRPSVGLFFGAISANSDKEKSGKGGLVLGDFIVQLGLLLGAVAGIGKKFGLYTGLLSGIALLPLLNFGFIGLPFGVHYKQRIGIGIILPFYMTEWYIALFAGIVIFAIIHILKEG